MFRDDVRLVVNIQVYTTSPDKIRHGVERRCLEVSPLSKCGKRIKLSALTKFVCSQFISFNQSGRIELDVHH